MPELPEVETVRRMLEAHLLGRTVRSARLSGLKLREPVPRALPRQIRGRTLTGMRRHGKYLLIDLSGGLTIVSHLGMSGRWLFYTEPPERALPHVHARLEFEDGSELWFQDPRRFGVLRAVPTLRLAQDRALARLGPDPLATPPTGAGLAELAHGARVSAKSFLLDQRRIAGVGNIYASEILFRARVDPRRAAGRLAVPEWGAVAAEMTRVLNEAIARMGTTFSMYRTLWNEPGTYAEKLRVYDRADQPCRRCRTPIRRIVQAQRSTYFCPSCQPSRPARSLARGRMTRSRADRG